MKLKNAGLIFCFFATLIFPNIIFAQPPANNKKWTLNLSLSDEFNNSMNSNWEIIPEDLLGSWGVGNQKMIKSQIKFKSSGQREYIEFNAKAVNGVNYSAGITGNGFGYGFYEIEARVLRKQGKKSGLWPAFWTLKGGGEGEYYEEIDIFEPGACQVNKNEHDVGIHYYSEPGVRGPKHRIVKQNVNMKKWHKYSMEWLPDKVVFYLDNKPIGEIKSNVPTHPPTGVWIDLQVSSTGECGPVFNGLLGSFDINYFRYYELSSSD